MGSYFKLEECFLIEVAGLDAERYLNSRLTNDIRSLKSGEARIAAILNPQGKTEGLFCVLRESLDTFILLCDGGDRSEILSALGRYKVADALEFKFIDNFACVHFKSDEKDWDWLGVSVEELSNSELWVSRLGGCRAISRRRCSSIGLDIFGPEQELREVIATSGFSEMSKVSFDWQRLSSCLPSYPEEINANSLLLETGPRGAVSFDKGCYVGQEVIEKIESHGKLPRELVYAKVSAAYEFENGIGVFGEEASQLGKLVNSVVSEDGSETLVVLLLKSACVGAGDVVRLGSKDGPSGIIFEAG